MRFEWLQSPVAIFLGMVSGVLLGVYAKGAAQIAADFGDLFLSFLTMCAIPIMVGALVSSLSSLLGQDGAQLSIVKFVVVMLLGMVVVGAVGVVTGVIVRPGAGIDLSERRVLGEALVEYTFAESDAASGKGPAASGGTHSLFRGLLPSNPFVAFVEGNTIQVLILTVLFGILLGLLPKSMSEPMTQFAEVVFKVFQDAISWSLYFLAFGLMGIMAKIVLTTGAELLGATVKLIIFTHVVSVAVMALIAWCTAHIVKIPIREQIAYLKRPLVVAFGTRDSIATMPTVMTALTEQFRMAPEAVKLAVPLGILLCRFSLVVFYTISLIFAAQLYSIALQPLDLLIILFGSVLATLTTIGAPALAALGAASIIAQPLGLPFSAVLLIMTGILSVLDPILTMMNVHVVSSLTIIAAHRKEAASPARPTRRRAATSAQVGCLIAAVALTSAAPAFAAEAMTQYERSLPPDLARIVQKGELVVAMLGEERYPFFYLDEKGEWQGVDVDISREIAREFGVRLVFDRAARTYDGVVDRVDAGYADFAISHLSTTLQRSKSVLFTRSYIPLRQGLVINRVLLAQTGRERDDPTLVIRERGGKVGVLEDSSYVEFAGRRFPTAEIVEYPTGEALFEAVHRGEIMAALYDEHQIKQYALANPSWLVDVDVKLYDDSKDLIAMAVSWRNPYLHQWLDTYLQVNEIAWTIDELLEAYPPPWEGR